MAQWGSASVSMPLSPKSPMSLAIRLTCVVAVLVVALDCGRSIADDIPVFQTDVMAVLSKAGCNMGSCHGNQNGKGGFRLSLRGQDAHFDHRQITRQYGGRRVNSNEPNQSLLLLKPSGQVAHEGGTRFLQDSWEYRTLLRWLRAGAPGPDDTKPQLDRLEVMPNELVIVDPEDSLQLKATAFFSDGSQRDVTEQSVYETSNLSVDVDAGGLVSREDFGEATVVVRYLSQQLPVRVAFIRRHDDFVWSDPPANNYIDRFVFDKLRTLRINPSELSSDAEFARRAYQDALGLLPTADEARAFVASKDADKRAKLIDRLLSRPEFAEHWTLKWADILRNEEKVMDRTGVDVFHQWILESMLAGKPIDQFVRELVTADGSTYKNPPANYYRANRDPLTRGETTARLFMGVRLQCAKCHNHPFDRWTQDDYYSWAAVFARVDYKIIENQRKDKLDKNEFQGEQIVQFVDKGDVVNVAREKNASPRLLGADVVEGKDGKARLQAMASWLTSHENESFAKSQANWIWFHIMGRGLVEPVDDFRLTNPAVNPGLLDALAEDFAVGGFDLRHLVRSIMTSRVYQLSSEPNQTNQNDDTNFSRAIVRRLTAEQLLDAQSQVLDAPARFNGYPLGTRAGQLSGVRKVRFRDESPSDGDRFLTTFGKPERLLACECERSNETTLSQALVFICDGGMEQRITASGNRIDRLASSGASVDEIVDQLYWTVLTRQPTHEEMSAIRDLLREMDLKTGLQDVTWALMNSKEFIFRK